MPELDPTLNLMAQRVTEALGALIEEQVRKHAGLWRSPRGYIPAGPQWEWGQRLEPNLAKILELTVRVKSGGVLSNAAEATAVEISRLDESQINLLAGVIVNACDFGDAALETLGTPVKVADDGSVYFQLEQAPQVLRAFAGCTLPQPPLITRVTGMPRELSRKVRICAPLAADLLLEARQHGRSTQQPAG
jgi:hypothetical protein